MPIAHEIAGGMGGLRTAGDLVARMEMLKYRLDEGKNYVAKKLGTSTMDLRDEFTMRKLREKLGIGTITGVPMIGRGIEAKVKIAEVLGIRINSVERLKDLMKV